MFSDYMCCDLGLDIYPGKHVPKETNAGKKLSTTTSFIDDNESVDSECETESFMSVESDNYSFYRPDRNYFDIDNNSVISDCTTTISSISGSSKNEKQTTLTGRHHIYSLEDNPWTTRNKKMVRQPNEETFTFDDDSVSMISSKTIDTNVSVNSSKSSISVRSRFAARLAAKTAMCLRERDSDLDTTVSSIRSSLGRGHTFNYS